jgi:hypothetical protein
VFVRPFIPGESEMQALSSSIVALAGAVLIAGGAMVQHTDTQMFVMILGLLVGSAGLGTWVYGWIREPDRG